MSTQIHTDWKLREPTINLTKGEREWYEWALSGATDALDDDDWLRDNDDARTVVGQVADMRYRLETQGYDMLATQSKETERGGLRTLNSLLKKLELDGYFEQTNP